MSPIRLALLAVVCTLILPVIRPEALAQSPTGSIPSVDARVRSVRFLETPCEITLRG